MTIHDAETREGREGLARKAQAGLESWQRARAVPEGRTRGALMGLDSCLRAMFGAGNFVGAGSARHSGMASLVVSVRADSSGTSSIAVSERADGSGTTAAALGWPPRL